MSPEGQAMEQQIAREAEAHRRIAEVLEDKEFMAGVYEAMSEASNSKATHWKDVKRKYGGA